MKDKTKMISSNPEKLRTLEAFDTALAVRDFVILQMRETRDEHIYRALLSVVVDLERAFPVLIDENIIY